MTYLRYNLPIDSMTLVNRLREEKDVLVIPGQQFAMERFVRIGYGGDAALLDRGLELFGELLESLRVEAGSLV